MEIAGNWEGYYEYGYGYALPYFGERVNFTLTLEGNQGSFKGISNEERSDFSVPYEGTINGFVENEIISFIKTYPVFPQISEDDKIITTIEGKLEIEHTGFFDKKNLAIYGTWIIPDPDPMSIEEGRFCVGTWLLKRSRIS